MPASRLNTTPCSQRSRNQARFSRCSCSVSGGGVVMVIGPSPVAARSCWTSYNGPRVLGKPENLLPDDVPLDLARSAVDGLAHREEERALAGVEAVAVTDDLP